MDKELVSIITPTYNCAAFIKEAVESVIKQNHKNWELIIVDDCSTDNTKQILTPYLAKYPNIHYTCLEKKSGKAIAISEGLKQVKGDYVAFLNSYDEWTQEKLEMQIYKMKKNKAIFSSSMYSLTQEDGTSTFDAIAFPDGMTYEEMLKSHYPIEISTIMYDRRVIGDVQVPNIELITDYALCLQILRKAKECYGIYYPIVRHRLYSKLKEHNNLKLLKAHWHLYRHIEKLSCLQTIRYILCWYFVACTGFGVHERDLLQEEREGLFDSGFYE